MKRTVLLVVCLLAAMPAVGQEGIAFGPAGGEEDTPSRLVKCELLGFGASVPTLFATQLVRVTFTAYGFRAGASLYEGYGIPFIGTGGGASFPVHVGYTIWSRPSSMGPVQSMLPEVYAEAAAAFWQTSKVPFVRGSVYAGIEGFGLGVGLEAGVVSLGWDPNTDPHVRPEPITRLTAPYIALRVKLLAVTAGF